MRVSGKSFVFTVVAVDVPHPCGCFLWPHSELFSPTIEREVIEVESMLVYRSLTLGAHAQRGLWYLV